MQLRRAICWKSMLNLTSVIKCLNYIHLNTYKKKTIQELNILLEKSNQMRVYSIYLCRDTCSLKSCFYAWVMCSLQRLTERVNSPKYVISKHKKIVDGIRVLWGEEISLLCVCAPVCVCLVGYCWQPHSGYVNSLAIFPSRFKGNGLV